MLIRALLVAKKRAAFYLHTLLTPTKQVLSLSPFYCKYVKHLRYFKVKPKVPSAKLYQIVVEVGQSHCHGDSHCFQRFWL